ncbi:hypothetical protein T492DRAFT_903494 [Pavlovales sp. CCMP2436]|nr:hypothetical protein T492DRAFT_903494 [Pavlovales sp. CCMP2436]
MADMNSAFADAKSRSLGVTTRPATIGGSTFTHGVYHWAAALSIAANTNVTIKGSPSDIFTFITDGALSVAAMGRVILEADPPGGGKPQVSNIAWAVAGVMTFGEDSRFEGVCLGTAAATFGASVKFNGRVFTALGAISLGAAVAIVEPSAGISLGPQAQLSLTLVPMSKRS